MTEMVKGYSRRNAENGNEIMFAVFDDGRVATSGENPYSRIFGGYLFTWTDTKGADLKEHEFIGNYNAPVVI